MTSRSTSSRWRSAAGAQLAAQVLGRLLAGESLDDLPLDRHDGRIDLRGFAVPDPEILGVGGLAEERGAADIAEARGDGGLAEERGASDIAEERGVDEHPGLGMLLMGGPITVRGATLADLDLSGAHLDHLRFFDSTLRNCRFDKARCRDWRGWNLTVEESSFQGANLRDSALGTWHDGRGNSYRAVDFSGADLRGIVCQGAEFVDCEFTAARLDKVEFGGCDFVRCRFGGLLDEVRFLAEPMIGVDKPEPASMRDVDFSTATLRWVEFRGLTLDRVTLPPEGEEHVIVHHYPCVVGRAVDRLEHDLKPETRRLRARMLAEASQLDEGREIGLWHRDELGETVQQQRLARELLHELERDCSAAV
ncbi:MAG: pentapeptide repeat-containing protein [Dactylosporangium sp.]|nr:pentapeptide repeat-containing protein [Dactylosporangium sp.]